MKKPSEKASKPTEAPITGTPQNGSSDKSDTTSSNYSEQKVHFYEGSPIAILEHSEKGFTPVFKNNYLTREWKKNIKEVEERIQRTDWELILPTIYAIAKEMAELEIKGKNKK